MDITEPIIKREDILVLPDHNFNTENVCLVSGAGTGIGRATAIALAMNGLITVGLDINEEEGLKTMALIRDM
ncbi:MAG: D-beta-hydroxybutyrate dehydrogenase, partial [Deltaproteobacteria bacterium]